MRELAEYGVEPMLVDPQADTAEAMREYGLRFADLSEVRELDAVVLAVAHREFRGLTMERIAGFFRQDGGRVLLDLKGILDRNACEQAGYSYWRL